MSLSNADLGLFFEASHHALAERLAGVTAFSHDAAAVGRALGAEHDLYRLLVPEDGPVDVRALCLVRERLGHVSPLADGIFAVQGLAATPVLLTGTGAQKALLLPAVRSGAALGGFALTEPGAGSDVAAIATTATRAGDGFVLDGEKMFISNAGIASYYVVFANTDPGSGRRGITAFLVDAAAPGLRTVPIPMSVDHPVGRLAFSGCHVTADAVIGEVGGGFSLAMRTLDTFRVTVGAAAVGMARCALEEAIRHVKTRAQFGKLLAEQQLVQAQVADMATELDASRLLVYRAAWARDVGQPTGAAVAMAKMYATEAAQRIIDRAVQLFGGLGVTGGQVVERLYREIRPLRIYEGTTEIQKLIIAKELLR